MPRDAVLLALDGKAAEEVDAAELGAEDRHDQRREEVAVLACHLSQHHRVVVLEAAQLLGQRLLLLRRQLHRAAVRRLALRLPGIDSLAEGSCHGSLLWALLL